MLRREHEPKGDMQMQTQSRQLYSQLGRIGGIATTVATSAAVIATFLVWAPPSMGGGDTAPVRIAAAPTRAEGAKDVSADPTRGSGDRPARPTCAERGEIAASQKTEKAGAYIVPTGCGTRSNLAAGAPASHRNADQGDVATFLAWHMQARNSIEGFSNSPVGAVRQAGERAWPASTANQAPTSVVALFWNTNAW